MYLIEDILQLVLCQSGTLDIFHCAEFLRHPITIFLANRLHLLASELVPNARIVAQISLRTDDQAGDTRAVMVDFGEPLFPDVLEGGR